MSMFVSGVQVGWKEAVLFLMFVADFSYGILLIQKHASCCDYLTIVPLVACNFQPKRCEKPFLFLPNSHA